MRLSRNARKLVALTLSAALVLGGVAVNGSSASAAKKATLKLNKKSAKLTVGKKVTLKVTKKNVKSAKVTWKSSKKAVASVSKKGVVTAKKAGTAKISATVKYKAKGSKKTKKKTLKCTVKVTKKTVVASKAPAPSSGTNATNAPGGDNATPTPAPGGDTATPTPAPGGDTATPTPAPGGDTATPTPAPGGDTATPTPAPGGDTATPTPAPGGDTATPTPTPAPGGDTATATPTPAPGGDTATPTPAPGGDTATPTPAPEPYNETKVITAAELGASSITSDNISNYTLQVSFEIKELANEYGANATYTICVNNADKTEVKKHNGWLGTSETDLNLNIELTADYVDIATDGLVITCSNVAVKTVNLKEVTDKSIVYEKTEDATLQKKDDGSVNANFLSVTASAVNGLTATDIIELTITPKDGQDSSAWKVQVQGANTSYGGWQGPQSEAGTLTISTTVQAVMDANSITKLSELQCINPNLNDAPIGAEFSYHMVIKHAPETTTE